jgi:uncharacterized protein YydD (DUF2326 family)
LRRSLGSLSLTGSEEVLKTTSDGGKFYQHLIETKKDSIEENISKIRRSLETATISDNEFEGTINIDEQVASTATHKGMVGQILFDDLEMSDMTWDAKKANPENKDSVKWKCHPQLCKYKSINIEICQKLFSDIADMSEEESSTYSLVIGYLDDLDICKSSFTLLQKHGHSYYCHPKNGSDSAF